MGSASRALPQGKERVKNAANNRIRRIRGAPWQLIQGFLCKQHSVNCELLSVKNLTVKAERPLTFPKNLHRRTSSCFPLAKIDPVISIRHKQFISHVSENSKIYLLNYVLIGLYSRPLYKFKFEGLVNFEGKKKRKGTFQMNLQPIINDSKLGMSKHFVNGFQSIINKVYFCLIQPNGFGGVSDGLGKSYENFM